MKKIALFITLLFCNTTLFAQNTFEKIIDTLGSGGANCIQETYDGGYIYGGVCSLNGNDAIIVKLDSIGTIEWVKTYSGPSIEGVLYLEQIPDSGYMVNALYDGGANSKSWLLRLDANGDTLWTKTFSVGIGPTLPPQQNSMASVNNVIYGLSGYYIPPSFMPDIFFISVTGNGFLLSSKVYTTPFSSDGGSIWKTHDGGFIMAGEIGTPSFHSDIYMIRTNTYGDTLWTKSYDLSYHEVAQDIKQTNDRYNTMRIILKDSGTKTGFGLSFIVPSDYVGTAYIGIVWGSNATSGNNVVFDVDYKSSALSATLDPSSDDENATTTAADSTTSQMGVVTEIALTSGNLGAGERFDCNIMRDGASGSDTLASDIYIAAVYLKYNNN